jgi:lipopolysaccharide biosynthesis glycosyltransferase
MKEQNGMLQIFIGYDPREAVAFHVLSHSIHARASVPVTVAPLMLSELKDVFHRERHALQSTDFSFSRFMVPYLSNYTGWSLFCDCDMLMLDDVKKLWDLRDDRFAVQVVKHDHKPADSVKFLDQPQRPYEKKNWSSVILFNNARCKALTPEYANTASGLELHQFKWLGDDNLIGELPLRWNYLVDYYETVPPKDVSFLHFTEGGPYFEAYKNCSYADVWFAERERMLFAG